MKTKRKPCRLLSGPRNPNIAYYVDRLQAGPNYTVVATENNLYHTKFRSSHGVGRHKAKYRDENIPEWMNTACDMLDLARDVHGKAFIENFGKTEGRGSYVLFATKERSWP